MAVALSKEALDKSLKGFLIPPRPQVLASLGQEMRGEHPNMAKVGKLIGADVGLAAAVLKTVNSPFFGLRAKISSISQAVTMLGVKSTIQIVTGLTLRSVLPATQKSMESYWDGAEKVASIAALIAPMLPNVAREDAYIFGLFHDVGIPMLMGKYPDYAETIAIAAASERVMTAIEDERHGTNHATLGYIMAKSWFLSEPLCEGILSHHDLTVFDPADPTTPYARTMIAMAALAEHLNDSLNGARENIHWERIGALALDHLGISETEYLDIRAQVLESGM